MVGRGGLEPPTSRLSGVRSNHLSYRPASCRGFAAQNAPVERFEACAERPCREGGAIGGDALQLFSVKGYEDGLAAFCEFMTELC
jgi:hypothetical protein